MDVFGQGGAGQGMSPEFPSSTLVASDLRATPPGPEGQAEREQRQRVDS